MVKVKLTKKQESHLRIIERSMTFINKEMDNYLVRLEKDLTIENAKSFKKELKNLKLRYDNELKNMINWCRKENLPLTRDIQDLL